MSKVREGVGGAGRSENSIHQCSNSRVGRGESRLLLVGVVVG